MERRGRGDECSKRHWVSTASRVRGWEEGRTNRAFADGLPDRHESARHADLRVLVAGVHRVGRLPATALWPGLAWAGSKGLQNRSRTP